MKNDIYLAETIRIMKKDFFFVRTKLEFHLENEEKCKTTTFESEKVLRAIQNHCVDILKQNNIGKSQIFLISNNDLSKYEFPILKDSLLKDLPAQKNKNCMLSVLNISEAFIEIL
jgi:hypothetical protein